MGWSTVKNGELLVLASASFDVFVTVDRNLSFQQNLANLPVAVVVLRAKSNRLANLMPLVPKLLEALTSIKPNSLVGYVAYSRSNTDAASIRDGWHVASQVAALACCA